MAEETKVGEMLVQGLLECHFKVQRMFVVMKKEEALVVGDALQIREDVLDLHQAFFEAGHGEDR